jgi:hypothetical protein
MEIQNFKISIVAKSSFFSMILCSLMATAYPNVGDKTEFIGESTQRGTANKVFTASREFTAFNADTGKWTIKEDLKTESEEWTRTAETDKIYTHENFMQIINSCIAEGGTLETLTLPIGNFDTCMLTAEDDDFDIDIFNRLKERPNDFDGQLVVWFGDVPSGIVKAKYKTRGGITHTMELSKVVVTPIVPNPPETPPQVPEIPEDPQNPQIPPIPQPPVQPEFMN